MKFLSCSPGVALLFAGASMVDGSATFEMLQLDIQSPVRRLTLRLP